MLTSKEKVSRPKGNKDTFDIILILFMTFLTCLLPLSSCEITQEVPTNNPFPFFKLLDFYFIVDESRAPSPWFYVPLFLIFGTALLYFIFHRYHVTKKGPSKVLAIFVTGLIVFRLASIFSFPYGETSFTFVSPLNQMTATLLYSGFSLAERAVEATADILFILFFAAVFTFFRTFGKKGGYAVNFLFVVFILLALAMNGYSYATEGTKISGNIAYLCGDTTAHFVLGIHSFLPQYNVYGFFLMVASLCAVILFFRKPNVFSLLLIAYFGFTVFVISSRTALIIITAASVLMLLAFPIFCFRRHKGYAITCLILFFAFALSVGTLFVLAMLNMLPANLQKLFTAMRNGGTFLSRIDHWKLAITMLNASPYFWIFGFEKLPFGALYYGFEHATGFEPLWTCHNGLLEVICYSGIIGLVGVLGGYGYLAFHIGRSLKAGNRKAIGLAIVGILLLIYGISEPRQLFLFEESSACFVAMILLPVEQDYGEALSPKENDTARERHRLLTASL